MARSVTGCIGGLHEVCVGVPDLDAAAAYFAAFGCRPAARGELDAATARALYGVDSPLQSLRLTHLDADHGLVRLMHWERPRNAGLGMGRDLRCVGSRWGVRLTSSVMNLMNHAQRARESGEPVAIIEPLLAVIGEVSGEQAARPFVDPIVGVREMVLIQPLSRQVFFERFGYESPLYGRIDERSLLRTSQHTHFGLMVADDDPHVLDFYEDVLGLRRMLDTHTPYGNATGSRAIFGLQEGEGFHMVDFDDPASEPHPSRRRSGKLKCVRFAASARIDRRLHESRAGSLGYSLYTWRAGDLESMHRRLSVAGVKALSDLVVDEFGRPALTFDAPDGYHWNLVAA